MSTDVLAKLYGALSPAEVPTLRVYELPNYRAAILIELGRRFPGVRLEDVSVVGEYAAAGVKYPETGATQRIDVWSVKLQFHGVGMYHEHTIEDGAVCPTIVEGSTLPANKLLVQSLVQCWIERAGWLQKREPA